jgi:glutathione S-transferase
VPIIRLYTQTTNPFSEKVAAALALKGLPLERVISDDPQDVARWSPIARTLPVLEVDGRRVTDSTQILEWLEARFPDPPLLARDPRMAESQRNLASWSDTSFVWYWNRWRAARFPQPGDEQPVDDSLLARLRQELGRALGSLPRSRAEAREIEIIGEIQDRLDDLVGFLGTRPFFYADEPSIADLSVYAMLLVLRTEAIPGMRESVERRPELMAFLERMSARVDASARETPIRVDGPGLLPARPPPESR